MRYSLTDAEKENDRTTKHPRDHVCHMKGGMLVKNGGPLLVKTDTNGSKLLTEYKRSERGARG